MLQKALLCWSEAGNRPYEYLQEEGLYDDFMTALSKSSCHLETKLYRGTHRHSELLIGDILTYEYPTSWSSSHSVALRFIEKTENPVMLELLPENNSIQAIENILNRRNEHEFILFPLKLRVVKKDFDGKITVLQCQQN